MQLCQVPKCQLNSKCTFLFNYRLVTSLVELGKTLGCYKITLNCTDKMIPFYNGFGFVAESGNANFLMIRIPQKL